MHANDADLAMKLQAKAFVTAALHRCFGVETLGGDCQ
jgi:hypothetical protein